MCYHWIITIGIFAPFFESAKIGANDTPAIDKEETK